MSSRASRSSLRHPRRKPIAASVAAIFAVLAPSAWAVPPAVTNCLDDNSGGTLREAVLGATSGDVIDMSALTCGTITLMTGAITISTLQTLTLHGPGLDELAIVGNSTDRVFKHTHADGQLNIDNLRVSHGSYTASSGPARGGCIYSQGMVKLTNVGVYYCNTTTSGTNVTNPAPSTGGGGVAAAELTISGGILYKNTVSASNAGVPALGGCAATSGTFDMRDSIVAYCQAIGPMGSSTVQGGALALGGNVTITGSMVGLNSSSWSAGGIFIASADPTAVTATISNSTITSNHAGAAVGGLFTNFGHVNINNSTIVLNTAPVFSVAGPPLHYYAPGVAIISNSGPVALSLQSTIIANNSSSGVQEDLSTGISPAAVAITGSNNLVRAYKSDVTLPGGQGNLTGVCPLLGPIRDNGGLTPTHALLSGSPAIDAGNNTQNDPHSPPPNAPALYDGRGPGFARESGTADIGAYEVQKSEIVFDAGFDGCP